MNKAQLAEYLASIVSLMNSIDDAGGINRPAWLKDEYQRTWKLYKEEVRKEQE